MHLATAKLSKSLQKFIHRHFGVDPGYASDEGAALAVSTLLEAQARMTPGEQQAVYQRLSELLHDIRSSLSLPEKAPQVAEEIDIIDGEIAAIDREQRTELVEASEKAILGRLEMLVDQIGAEPRLDPRARDAAILRIARWDHDRLTAYSSSPVVTDADRSDVITSESLTAYLRVRFEDPDLQLVAFSPKSGGYGKQTIFFETRGKLTGEFVLRRDRAEPLIDNDCHRVALEYPVLRAVKEVGFPAPDALWLDVDHEMLPGGDFLIMRRSPGAVQGTVFGGKEKLPDKTVVSFAQTVGRLHRLEPLVGLGDLNESTRSELWSLPLSEVVRRYIAGYYDYFLKHRISEVPSLIAVFRWLLDNVPPCEDRPVLVHGDLGLHNLLFAGDELSVVLDWEQSHVGDPMEDLGYIRNTANTSLDWASFVEHYEATSGSRVDPQRLHFQQIWGQAKNAAGSVLAGDVYAYGKSEDLNVAPLGFLYHPYFINEAMQLIEQSYS